MFNESTLTVYNHMRVLAPDGNVSDINGFAYATEDPGKLVVSLDGGSGNGNCECNENFSALSEVRLLKLCPLSCLFNTFVDQ